MICILAAALACLGLADEPGYDQMKAAAGRDAAAQVRLALWCEAHGLERERLRHLAVAVLADPSNAMARGLLGLVEYGGKWRRPEAVADALKADVRHADLVAEYNGRRVRTPVKPDAQWKLALWCEEKGLKDEARAHLATVVRLDPTHADAWRKLGYKRVGNRWVTESQAMAEKTEKQRQQEADKAWRPRLEHLRAALDGKGQRRDQALADLAMITDPRAVPAVWHALVERGGGHQVEAIQVLGQIDAVEASRALATLAVSARSDEVRRRAIETLRRRDPREWADLAIGLLRDKIKYEVKKVGGPGSPGQLWVEGKEANLRRIYETPAMPAVPILPGDTLSTDSYGLPVLVHHQYNYMPVNQYMNPLGGNLAAGGAERRAARPDPAVSARVSSLLPKGIPNGVGSLDGLGFAFDPAAQARWLQTANTVVVNETPGVPADMIVGYRQDQQIRVPVGQMLAEAQKASASAAEQLRRDVAAVEAVNAKIAATNERAVSVLQAATGVTLPPEPGPWRSWFVDQLGFKYKITAPAETPTVIEAVPPAYQPQPIQPQVVIGPTIEFVRHSCFGRGTPVRTLAGPKAIESIEVGDLVLTQDTAGGKLGYRPVVMAHHNPPSPTFEVALGGAPIVTSPSHRFWVAGRGWVMARDLKVGDPVRTLGGVARVAKIEAGSVQPVFNLDVETDADFFVGEAAALVHDNTLPDLKQHPFDAPQAVAAK